MAFAGDRKAYRRDAKPLGEGGYATVYRAVRKADNEVVAFKQLKSMILPEYEGRLRREIRVQTELDGHPHVMPVLDAGANGRWYVMPLAAGDLVKLEDEVAAHDRLVEALTHAAQGLAAAHALSYVHRDVTPRNILALDEDSGRRWVVSDWGLVRQPPGKTTTKWTKTGTQLGTEGFIAPEVLRDAHRAATPAADVYSLGRVLAWATTGEWPIAISLLLPDGPFRSVVRVATAERPTARPTLDEFVQLLQEADEPYAPDLLEQTATLAKAAEADLSAAQQLWAHALDHSSNPDVFFDSLARLKGENLQSLIQASPTEALQLVEAMKTHLLDDDAWGDRNFDYANLPLRWLQNVASHAAGLGEYGLLEDAATALFETDPRWNRFEQRRHSRSWLERLRGEAAATVARALRRFPAAIDWYMDENWSPSRSTDARIRSVLGRAP